MAAYSNPNAPGAEYAVNYLYDKLTGAGVDPDTALRNATVIAANLIWESGGKTDIAWGQQAGDAGTSWGAASWHGTRLAQLTKDPAWASPEKQMDFLWGEVQRNPTIMRSISDPALTPNIVSKTWTKKYEVASPTWANPTGRMSRYNYLAQGDQPFAMPNYGTDPAQYAAAGMQSLRGMGMVPALDMARADDGSYALPEAITPRVSEASAIAPTVPAGASYQDATQGSGEDEFARFTQEHNTPPRPPMGGFTPLEDQYGVGAWNKNVPSPPMPRFRPDTIAPLSAVAQSVSTPPMSVPPGPLGADDLIKAMISGDPARTGSALLNFQKKVDAAQVANQYGDVLSVGTYFRDLGAKYPELKSAAAGMMQSHPELMNGIHPLYQTMLKGALAGAKPLPASAAAPTPLGASPARQSPTSPIRSPLGPIGLGLNWSPAAPPTSLPASSSNNPYGDALTPWVPPRPSPDHSMQVSVPMPARASGVPGGSSSIWAGGNSVLSEGGVKSYNPDTYNLPPMPPSVPTGFGPGMSMSGPGIVSPPTASLFPGQGLSSALPGMPSPLSLSSLDANPYYGGNVPSLDALSQVVPPPVAASMLPGVSVISSPARSVARRSTSSSALSTAPGNVFHAANFNPVSGGSHYDYSLNPGTRTGSYMTDSGHTITYSY